MPIGRPLRQTPYTVMEDIPSVQVESPSIPIQSPVVKTNDSSYSGVKFGTAFADARRKGLKTFEWYNPKTKRIMAYTTQLKEEVQRKESPMTTYKQRGSDSIMNTYNRREQKPVSNSAIILSVNDKSNGDPVNTYKRQPNMTQNSAPPTKEQLRSERWLAENGYNIPGTDSEGVSALNALNTIGGIGLVKNAGQLGAKFAGNKINTLLDAILPQGGKGVGNPYFISSRSGLAPGMKGLGYETGTGQVPGNVDKLMEMITTGTNAGREAIKQRELFDFLTKTIKYGQSLQ